MNTTGFVMDATTLESLKEMMKSMPPLPQRASLFEVQPLAYKADDYDRFSWITGLPITITDHPLVQEEWTPPEDPFIEYEPKDYPWLKALGFGKTTTVRTAYAINRRCLTSFC
jgi:hypothetical protein